jgi:hypothetical protein
MGNRTKRKGRPRKYRTKRKCVTRKKVGGNFFLNWWNRKEIERHKRNMIEIAKKNKEISDHINKSRKNWSRTMRAMDGEKQTRMESIASDRNLSSREKFMARLELMTELATRGRNGSGNKKRRKKRKKKTKRKKKVVYT